MERPATNQSYPTASTQIPEDTSNVAVNLTTVHNHYEGMVHPGITTLVSCLIIALMLVIYLSMGSITSFIRRQRMRFSRGRNLSISNRALSSDEMNETTERARKKAVLVQSYKKTTNLTSESSNDMLSCFANASSKDTTPDIRSTVESSSKEAKFSQSSDDFQIIASKTSARSPLHESTDASIIEMKKNKITTDDHNNNQPKEVEMPLISSC